MKAQTLPPLLARGEGSHEGTRSRDEQSDRSRDVENLLDENGSDNSKYFHKWFDENQSDNGSNVDGDEPGDMGQMNRPAATKPKQRDKKKSKKTNRKGKLMNTVARRFPWLAGRPTPWYKETKDRKPKRDLSESNAATGGDPKGNVIATDLRILGVTESVTEEIPCTAGNQLFGVSGNPSVPFRTAVGLSGRQGTPTIKLLTWWRWNAIASSWELRTHTACRLDKTGGTATETAQCHCPCAFQQDTLKVVVGVGGWPTASLCTSCATYAQRDRHRSLDYRSASPAGPPVRDDWRVIIDKQMGVDKEGGRSAVDVDRWGYPQGGNFFS